MGKTPFNIQTKYPRNYQGKKQKNKKHWRWVREVGEEWEENGVTEGKEKSFYKED